GGTGYRPRSGDQWRCRLDRTSADDSALLPIGDLGVVILFVCASVFPRTGFDLFWFIARDSDGARIGPLSFLSLLRRRSYLAVLHPSTTASDSRNIRRLHQNEIAGAIASCFVRHRTRRTISGFYSDRA